MNSEVAKVFETSKGGYFFDSSDLENCLQTIENLKSNDILSKEIGKNARSYIIKNYSKEEIFMKFSYEIQKLLNINL